jgi:hypothetical protein
LTKRITKEIVLRGSETEVGFLRPSRQQIINYMLRISARVQRKGMENPRFRLEAPAIRMTLDTRQRQLHDEDKSCGTQPAYIRVIYRRLRSCALTRISSFNKKEKTKKAVFPLDRSNTYQPE